MNLRRRTESDHAADLRREFERAGVAVAVLSDEGLIVSCSEDFAGLFGEHRDDFVGASLVQHCPEDWRAEVLAMSARVIEGVSEVEHIEFGLDDAHRRTVRLSLNSIESSTSSLGQILAVLTPVSAPSSTVTGGRRRRSRGDRSSLIPADRYRSTLDARTLEQVLDLARERAQRSNSPLSVMMVEVLGLAEVVEGLDEGALAMLVAEYGERISSRLRASDQVARVGDAQYLVIAEDLGDEQDAAGVAYRLLSAMVEPVVIGSNEICLGMTLGVVVADGTDRPGQLLREAAATLELARTEGAGGFRIHDLRSHV